MDILIAASTDWLNTFYPAVQAFLNSEPFHIYNAPWTLFPLIPFATFPWGRELLFLASMGALGFTAYRLGASPFGVALFLLSPLVFDALLWGNVEWLALLGLAVSPWFGLVLLAIKPQMTIAVMAFLVIESWRKNGTRRTICLLIPLAIVTLLSFAVFGLWFVKSIGYKATLDANLFPWSIPVGIVLFGLSLRTHNIRYAIAASPMFFYTLTPQCWMVVFLALVPSLPKISFASLGAWGYVAAMQFGLR